MVPDQRVPRYATGQWNGPLRIGPSGRGQGERPPGGDGGELDLSDERMLAGLRPVMQDYFVAAQGGDDLIMPGRAFRAREAELLQAGKLVKPDAGRACGFAGPAGRQKHAQGLWMGLEACLTSMRVCGKRGAEFG
jgi:hypothetical protein